MGRQLRLVAKNWKHPKDKNGNYIPLLDGDFKSILADYKEGERQWNNGFRKSDTYPDFEWIKIEDKYKNFTYEQWTDKCPVIEDYMPQWSEKEKTHIQLYENTTEGTPISPVFKASDVEKLAEYMSKNCTTFADYKQSKKDWLEIIKNDLIIHREGNTIFI